MKILWTIYHSWSQLHVAPYLEQRLVSLPAKYFDRDASHHSMQDKEVQCQRYPGFILEALDPSHESKLAAFLQIWAPITCFISALFSAVMFPLPHCTMKYVWPTSHQRYLVWWICTPVKFVTIVIMFFTCCRSNYVTESTRDWVELGRLTWEVWHGLEWATHKKVLVLRGYPDWVSGFAFSFFIHLV